MASTVCGSTQLFTLLPGKLLQPRPAEQHSTCKYGAGAGHCSWAGAALRAVRKCRKCGENQSEFGRGKGRYQIAEFLGECSLLTELNGTIVPSYGAS